MLSSFVDLLCEEEEEEHVSSFSPCVLYSWVLCVCVLARAQALLPLHLFMVSEPGLGKKELWEASKKQC